MDQRLARASIIGLAGLAFLTGCGGGSTASFPSLTDAGRGAGVSLAAWDQCLRDHGVSVPAGYDPYNPPKGTAKLDAGSAATSACAVHLPPAPPAPDTVRKMYLVFTQCMREHGIPAPDPSLTPDGNVVVEYPPGVNPRMPGFTAAAATCHAKAGLGSPAASPSPTG